MTDAAAILAQYGLVNTAAIVQAALLEGVELPVAATVFSKESSGRMVWGSDPVSTGGVYTKGGPVTQANYLAYRALANSGKIGRQGCGMSQLTSRGFQDSGDALGGCWDPIANARAGLRGLQSLIRTYGIRDGARRYNGSGPAAERYAADFMARYATWKARLAGASVPTPGGAVTPPAPTYGNTGVRGLDYSAGVIAGAAIKAAGFSFVVRYVDDPAVGLSRKHITPGEYRELTSAGVDVYLVHEVATTDMLGGHDAGVAHAKRARAGADWIGYPPGAPIFVACDMHLTAAQIPTALAYVDGAVSVLGDACGVYGFWELVDACIAQRKGSWFWQAGISPSSTDPVHLWQRNDTTTVVGGIACDINELRIPLEDSDMTPDQDARLSRIEAVLRMMWEQFAGAGADPFDDAKRFTGWPAFDGGTPGNRTLVDIGRQADVDIAALRTPKQP